MTMRTRHHSQRSACCTAVIDMQANGDHLLEEFHRGEDIVLPLFLRPPGQKWMFDLVLHGDAEILMKRYEPISFLGLVEQRALNGDMRFWQRGSDLWMASDS